VAAATTMDTGSTQPAGSTGAEAGWTGAETGTGSHDQHVKDSRRSHGSISGIGR